MFKVNNQLIKGRVSSPYLYMENCLNSYIFSNDKQSIIFIDASSYIDYPAFPLLKVTTPTETEHTLNYNPNNSTVINSSVLFDIDGVDLADGIYKITQSIAPNDEVYKHVYYLKTDKVKEKIKDLLYKVDINDKELINKIFEMDLLLEGAKVSTERGSFKVAIEKYNLVKKEIDRFLNC